MSGDMLAEGLGAARAITSAVDLEIATLTAERNHYQVEAGRWRQLYLDAELALRDAQRPPRWVRVGPRG